MSEREFELGGNKFKLGKLDAFKQFHIVRRLGPILGDIIPVAQKLAAVKMNTMSETEKLTEMGQLAAPIMQGFAKLSDADANFVLLGLCSSVEIFQAETNNYMKVATPEMLLYQLLPLPALLQIAGRAFAYNLSGFFPSAPQNFKP